MFYFLNNLIIFVRCKVIPTFFKLYLQGCCRIKNCKSSRSRNLELYMFRFQGIIFALLLSLSLHMQAQTFEQIKYDARYIYGEGRGASLEEADNAALAGILSQISIVVKSDFFLRDRADEKNHDAQYETQYESVIRTYSQAKLPDCKRIILVNGPDEFHCVRFIKRSDVDRSLEARGKKIVEMLKIAERAERELKIGDALRYYYWSQILSSTLRYPEELYYDDLDGNKQHVSAWLPAKINSILSDITVRFEGYNSDNRTMGNLAFRYKNAPVASLDYTYFDGVDWSCPCIAKDGVGYVEFRSGTQISSIQVKIEYIYKEEARMDKEIENVLSTMNGVNYPKAFHCHVPLKSSKKDRAIESVLERTNNPLDFSTGSAVTQTPSLTDPVSLDGKEAESYARIVEEICRAITSREYDGVKKHFAEEGYSIFQDLICYGEARVLDSGNLSFVVFNGEVSCRSIPMKFSFKTNRKSFVEDVVFTFNEEKKITNISFALSSVTVKDIMRHSRWPESAKMVLINFLENYQTAFALKRLDYISSIFSDNALIITGRVVQRADVENQFREKGEYIEYNRQNKEEYLRNLKWSFRSKEYVNLNFANMEVLKTGKGEAVYSIQIKQDYYSSNYGDSGYLFLLVDVKNPKRPMIDVRAWQPKPHPDFGIFGPGNI